MAENNERIRLILSKYEEIEVVEEFDLGIKFKLFDIEYAIMFFNDNAFPTIFAIDDISQYPHFALREIPYNGQTFKSICLFEDGLLIEYIHPFEEKISLCIERLISLVKMSRFEIVKEYHKEFLVYWNARCITAGQYGQYKYSLFLDNDSEVQWLQQQIFKDKNIRITKPERFFNDAKDKQAVQTAPVLFLPIIDSRELLPPLKSSKWGADQINDIVHGVKYSRISEEAYNEIKNIEFHKKEIFLVFKLNNYCFGCMIKFSDSRKISLLNKFQSQIESVIPLKINRCDHAYLNSQIGNKTSDKKIAIIGAGSLGSYVANELIYAGHKNILIIDHDKFQYDNTFRHRVPWFANDLCKSFCVASTLNNIHPEINAQYMDVFLNEDNYKKILVDNNVELIIFTVGSSDVQLRMNKMLAQDSINIPVYYAWLEHDGETSHVAIVNSYEKGCFECLYTDEKGDLGENIVNKADKTTITHIRNGCGGTRVPYGNRTLLTASTLVLMAINDNKNGNWLYSYYNGKIDVQEFPKNGRCRICDLC